MHPVSVGLDEIGGETEFPDLRVDGVTIRHRKEITSIQIAMVVFP